ncbi:MAG TPA: hypothetical protein VLK84_20500 [Longimicrobium sp.]|nr:hypothetical protein [Longimicrobium sp.]
MTPTYAETINPLAGLHVVTSDPEEIEASARAAETSLRAYPYYRERFGDRARMFGASDGAWLVTLCQGERDYVRRQVLWLGTLLSARGVPRWLLERHLEILHRELLGLTLNVDRCQPLLEAALFLRALRREQVTEREFARLSAAFDERVGPEWAARLPGMGSILVSAVADEAAGIARAVESIAGWAEDPSLFPEPWIAAVRRTLADARSVVLPPPDGLG